MRLLQAVPGAQGNPGIIDQRIKALKEQVTAAEKNGKSEVARSKQAQLKKYERIKSFICN